MSGTFPQQAWPFSAFLKIQVSLTFFEMTMIIRLS